MVVASLGLRMAYIAVLMDCLVPVIIFYISRAAVVRACVQRLMYVFTDKGDAQATAAVPQCCVCIFFWKPSSIRSNTEAVQHQGQVTKLFIPIMVGAIVELQARWQQCL
jgi:hypothetical protein